MILRRWRGAVRREDADRYLDHQRRTGVRDHRDTPGNVGIVVLRRDLGELVEVVTLTLWESLDAVTAFAGDPPTRARFYPGDDDLLVEKALEAEHFEVVDLDLGGAVRP